MGDLRALRAARARDLRAAGRLQQALLPKRFCDFGAARVSLLLRSCSEVGGDLVGHYPIGRGRIGLYALDVSGHGVSAAMLTARLHGLLSGAVPEQNVALRRGPGGEILPRRPHEAAARLNRQLIEGLGADHYMTLLLGDLDLAAGRLSLVQAGHPHPALIRPDGAIRFLGEGGLPIGLVADAAFRTVELCLSPGDRLLVYSDGMTECPAPGGRMVGEDGLARLIARHAGLSGPAFLGALAGDLCRDAGAVLPDDMSALLLEYDGPGGSRS
ncbi:PP2C family protein-serine/threonine phosphatase [Rhodovulum sp. YNF3179]|uniref:PP2C family protein-serine/threonine phosphatase n=1 Tax=Rhodovulum sp. YNF3179 TaxID=3425127 RepID=UPI003D354AFE